MLQWTERSLVSRDTGSVDIRSIDSSRFHFHSVRHRLHVLPNAALSSTIFAVDDSRVTIANDGASVWVKTSAQDKVIVGV